MQLVLPSYPDITAYWMWNEHGTNFVLYDIQSSVDMELAFASGNASVDLSKCTCRLPYTIDFYRMEQTRHSYNTRRKIQRCPLPPGFSLQSLLAIAPGLTGPTGLVGGGTAGMMMSHGTGGGGGFVFHPAAPGYGSGPFPNPAPTAHLPPPAGMINFAPTVPPAGGHMTKSGGIPASAPFSVPAGPTPSLSTTHMGKSGMVSTSTPAFINSMTTGPAPSFPTGGLMGKSGGLTTTGGLTSKSSPAASRAATKTKTKTLAVLGAAPAAAPSTSRTILPTASTSTAARPYTGSTSSSASALSPPSTNASTATTVAASPQKRRRRNKTTSASSAAASSSSSSGGGPATHAAIKAEKSKARRRRKEKKGAAANGGGSGSKGYGDETSKYARKKKKLKKGEDGVSKLRCNCLVLTVDNCLPLLYNVVFPNF